MSVITKPQFFGLTNFAIVQGTKFACEVSTAPAGLFKGYTMRVSVFDPSLDWKEAFEKRQLLPAAMVTLHPGLTKAQRTWLHDRFARYLDEADAEGFGFCLSLVINLDAMKKEGHVIDYMLHPFVQQAIDEGMRDAQTSNAA